MYAERAMASEPTHFGALTTAGEILTRLWRAEEAIPILRYVSKRDPLSVYHFDNLAKAYMTAGQYESAEEAYQVVQILEPDDADWPGWGIGLTSLLQGKASEALHYFDENVTDMPLRWHGKMLALHDMGRTEEALTELGRLLDAAGRIEDEPGLLGIYWFIGTAYAWSGAVDEAFEYFEKQRDVFPRIFTSMGDSPLYASLRDDPRWQPFLASVGLDPDSLASVPFNPRLPSAIR
jgi:tetratricopeptide (TPR) repeat protein